MKKNTVGTIFCVILLVLMLSSMTVLFMHLDSVRLMRIEKQLQSKYALTVDDKGINLDDNKCYLTTSEGVSFSGTCDWFGNVKTDSYVNYYYADECVKHIRDKIAYCFTESVVVADGIKISELASIEFDTKAINSYEDYVAATKTAFTDAEFHKQYYKIGIRVYVRETEDVHNIYDAEAVLLSDKEYFDVYFFAVPDEIFDIHKDNGVYAYYKGKAIDEMVNELDSEYGSKLLEVIYHYDGMVDELSLWKNDDEKTEEIERGTGVMLVISSTIEGPIDYNHDNRPLGVTYSIDWNGIITKSTEYLSSGSVEDGSLVLSPEDFRSFYDFAEDAYRNNTYAGYVENDVSDGSTYGFTYYPAGSSSSVHLFGGYCYSNEKLWGMVELARSYFA